MRAALIGLGLLASITGSAMAETASINGLDMYYEVHGEGAPLVLLHGAYMSIRSNWEGLIPTLAQDHKVIAVELQSHGHTNDREGPITYEGMADDVAALLDHLGIEKASVFGFSMGGGVAIRMAMQHPDKVERLIAASASISYDALPEGFEKMIEGITPEMFAGTPFEAEYKELNPNPEGFPTLVEKLKHLDLQPFAWPEEEFAKIDVPTMLIFGDADIVSLEHATKLWRLLGGVGNADMNGLPKVQLQVLPGTSHIGVFFNPTNVEILKQTVPAFLKAQLPAPPQMPQ